MGWFLGVLVSTLALSDVWFIVVLNLGVYSGFVGWIKWFGG